MSLPSAAAGLRGHEDLLGAFQLREDVARYCAPTLNDSTALFEFVQEPEQLARRNVDMGSLPENSKKRETKRSAQGNDRYADHEDTRLLPVLQRDPGRPLLNDTQREEKLSDMTQLLAASGATAATAQTVLNATPASELPPHNAAAS